MTVEKTIHGCPAHSHVWEYLGPDGDCARCVESALANIADDTERAVAFARKAAEEWGKKHDDEATYPHLVGGLGAVIEQTLADLRAVAGRGVLSDKSAGTATDTQEGSDQ